MSTQASRALQALALKALQLDQRAKEFADLAKAAKEELYAGLDAEGLLDPDIHGVGDESPVRLTITPNRYFDLEAAQGLVTKKAVLESTVKVVDPKLLKSKMTGEQVEAAMKFYPQQYKLGLKISD